MATLRAGTENVEIDARLDVRETDALLIKKCAARATDHSRRHICRYFCSSS